MSILIDCSAIKSGGGVQQAQNFLDQLINLNIDFYIILPDKGELIKYQNVFKERCIIAPSKLLERFWFEYIDYKRFLKGKSIRSVYTVFGAGLPRCVGIKSVVNVAYPIICYPDSPYWRHIGLRRSLPQRVKNKLRCLRLGSADIIVVETTIMQERVASQLNISKNKIQVIPPAVTEYLHSERPDSNVLKSKPFNILVLGGLSPHKNVTKLVPVVSELLQSGVSEFKILISCKKDEFLAICNNTNISSGVLDKFAFLGIIDAAEIDSVYNEADALLNLSDLESFSNNYMEAWKAGIPLICSKRDFAEAICGESAVYVEPHDIASIVSGIKNVIYNSDLRVSLVAEGKKNLRKLPSNSERFNAILKLILPSQMTDNQEVR